MHTLMPIDSNSDMEHQFGELCRRLYMRDPINRGEVHAQATTSPEMFVRELFNVNLEFEVNEHPSAWLETVKPNMPWAEDHFQERISGDPLNPPPSEQYWPYAQQGNASHKSGDQFSHTYPERFWPRFANSGGKMKHSQRVVATPIVGIRFEYGDFEDLINLLRLNPLSRQAYLPIWFPEDLNAANHRERVPCSLGYHFLVDGNGKMNMTYTLRSCDLIRFFRDDMYMAGRLLQVVAAQIPDIEVGNMAVHIFNLHCFVGDDPFLLSHQQTPDKRAHYNLGAIL